MNYMYNKKGKAVACELTPGEQLVLIKENISRAVEHKLNNLRPMQVGEILYLTKRVKKND